MLRELREELRDEELRDDDDFFTQMPVHTWTQYGAYGSWQPGLHSPVVVVHWYPLAQLASE